MSNDKLVSFQKKETQEVLNVTTLSMSNPPIIPYRKIHRCHPEGVILYKQRDEIIAAYSYVIALSKYRDENVTPPSNLKLYGESEYNIDDLILLLSKRIPLQVSVKELQELHNKEKSKINIYTYPGMIIRVHGYIRKIIDETTFIVEYDEKEIIISLIQQNNLYKESKFIIDRFVFVIGSIKSLENNLFVTTLAILV